ncbi:MAG: hypothetical protein KAW17_05775 [Candidatus Eisenbacteria sp.]|nr:hypothetical protein [Candidatus Eisenbacteria bacterium]
MDEELRQRLIEAARSRGVLHYKDAARVLHIDWERLDHCQRLFQELDDISTFEHEQGRPLLSVVVVREEDHRPGKGFFKMARRCGKQTPQEDDDTFFAAELKRTHDYWVGQPTGPNEE